MEVNLVTQCQVKYTDRRLEPHLAGDYPRNEVLRP
jgi:hypothetical protein